MDKKKSLVRKLKIEKVRSSSFSKLFKIINLLGVGLRLD